MTRFALKGLLGRKLRTALTAIAIVLGVAMVSGTYVLTDSIDCAFDAIFTEVRGRARRDHHRQVGVRSLRRQRCDRADPSTSRSSRRCAGSTASRRRRAASTATRHADRARTARRSSYGGAPNLGFAIAHGESHFNPLTLVEGEWPGPNEVVIDESHRRQEDLKVGDTIGVQAEGPVERLQIVRASSGSARSRSIGGATLAGFDLPTAQRLFEQGGQARRDRGRRRAPASPDEQLIERDQRRPAAGHAGAHAAGAGRRGRLRHERVHHLPPGLPARLRRDRALRRQLRDRELALDHDRAADARVRNGADARRLPPPGPRLDRDRGARRRRRSPPSSASSSGSGSRSCSSRSSTPSASRCRTPGLLFETRTIVVSLVVGHPRDAARQPAARRIRATRVPPIAAVREGATLPESRFAALPRGRGSLVTTGARLRGAPLRALRQRPRDDAESWSGWASARS